MYKIPVKTRTNVEINNSVEGETIEQEITRLINEGAPIENDKMPIYTKPSEGVVYGTDIRGDKWDKAIDINEKMNADIDRLRALKQLHKKVKGTEEDEEKTDGKPSEEQPKE